MGVEGGGGGATSKLKKAARRMMVAACASFSSTSTNPPALLHPSSFNISGSGVNVTSATKPKKVSEVPSGSMEDADAIITNENNVASKNLCAICLDALNYCTGNSPGQAIFTAQCSHSFHFTCISSNVRHGSVTCPICRAHWTQLPRNLNPPCSLSSNLTDPIFQILDDSIANFRVHRRSFLRSARYDDDDPIEPENASNLPRLSFSLLPIPPTLSHHPCTQLSSLLSTTHGSHCHYHHHLTGSAMYSHPPTSLVFTSSSNRRASAAYLLVKLTRQPAIDLVMVACPNGPHLRLVKQSMALVVFSLRPIDRLAIVTYSSAAARVFPLRRMTSYGKRTALQVIDRLFYMGQADPFEGLKKGIKILEDRVHKNSESCILHLSDSPTRSYHGFNMHVPIPIHRFHVGFGFGTSNGFVMHEFEEFLGRVVGGVIRDLQLRIGEEGRILRVGELRGNEQRMILLELGESGNVCVGYSYTEGGVDEYTRTGETLVSVGDKGEGAHDDHGADTEADTRRDVGIVGGRASNAECWEHHDPYMARRWAKHLHGYRL